jgi:hypothetical protein
LDQDFLHRIAPALKNTNLLRRSARFLREINRTRRSFPHEPAATAPEKNVR